MTIDPRHPAAVIIDYTNWRGERRKRIVIPHAIAFTETAWHEGEQWMLRATDVEKGLTGDSVRLFAMKDIHSWEPATEEALTKARLDGQIPMADLTRS